MGKDKDRELTPQLLANTIQSTAQSNSSELVFNLSSTPLFKAKESLLSKGPNYAVAPKNLPPWIHYFYRISHQKVVLRSCQPPKPNLNKEELKALTELRKNSNMIVLTVDKGVAMVVMDKKDYIDKTTNILSQLAYGTIDRDQTNKLKEKHVTLLMKIKRETGVEDYIYRDMYSTGCTFHILWTSEDP